MKQEYTKWDYIKKISGKSDRYGNLLVAMMDEFEALNLQMITLDQAMQFWKEHCEGTEKFD